MKLTAVERKNLPKIKENIFCDIYYILKTNKRPITVWSFLTERKEKKQKHIPPLSLFTLLLHIYKS